MEEKTLKHLQIMALCRDLQISKDAKQLMSAVDNMTINMRRDRKFNLGNRMFQIAMEIPELIGHANRVSGQARKDTLNIVLEKLDHLDFLNEYCLEFKYTSLRTSSNISYCIDKVAKQTVGWRNYSAKTK